MNLSAWHAGNPSRVKEKRMHFLLRFCPVRPVKLDFFDHAFVCPLCKVEIVYTSMHTVIVSSQRKCPSCKGELLIHDGTATAIDDKKPPKRAIEPSAKRSRR
jgi:hypothetical protein